MSLEVYFLCNFLEEFEQVPGFRTLQILLRFEPHGEHMLGVHTAQGCGTERR